MPALRRPLVRLGLSGLGDDEGPRQRHRRYSVEACIGCRYCVAACPFGVPRFTFDTPDSEDLQVPAVQAPLRRRQVRRLRRGLPHRRHALRQGEGPQGRDRPSHGARARHHAPPSRAAASAAATPTSATVGKYVDHVYGEKEIGGTQVLHLSGVPFELLDKPALPDRAPAADVGDDSARRVLRAARADDVPGHSGGGRAAQHAQGRRGAARRAAEAEGGNAMSAESAHLDHAARAGRRQAGDAGDVVPRADGARRWSACSACASCYGLGATTNLNNGYPWGLWIAYDVVSGSALAGGGFSTALLVYILNRGEYHPLIRPALIAALLGYLQAGFSVIFDLGRCRKSCATSPRCASRSRRISSLPCCSTPANRWKNGLWQSSS